VTFARSGYITATDIERKVLAMTEPDRTRPSDKTRAEEEVDAHVTPQADDMPTPDEERAAERAPDETDEAARAYKEALERGAHQPGEGRIP